MAINRENPERELSASVTAISSDNETKNDKLDDEIHISVFSSSLRNLSA